MRRPVLTFLCIFVVAFSALAQPKTIRVPQDQSTIQGAINAAANGDTVLVAEGTYDENITLNKKIVLASLFIMDGNRAHIANTIIDGSTPTHPDSGSVIIVTGTVDTTTVIKGFTLRGGKGLYRYVAPDHLMLGGGIWVGAGARVSNNIIHNNSASNVSRQGFGGGVTVSGQNVYTIIEDNTITGNTAGGTYAEGGGIFTNGGTVRIDRNVIMNNAALNYGGGLQLYGGTISTVTGCYISENTSQYGGAVSAFISTATVQVPTVTFSNNIIRQNGGISGAPAIYVNGGTYTFINNTITGHSAATTAGAIAIESAYSGTFRLLNNILWNPGAAFEMPVARGVVSAAYNLIRGGWAGTANVSADPLFVSSHADSLGWFRFNSPAANAGAVSASVGGVLLTAPITDFYGHSRFGPAPDIGAFEDGPWSAAEDLEPALAVEFALDQNYPNPFNPATSIAFRIPTTGYCRLAIFDLLGREVAVLVDEEKAAGSYAANWDASRMPSGIYLYALKSGSFVMVKRMVLIK